MRRALLKILACVLTAGCHASIGTNSTPPTPTPAPSQTTARSEADVIRDFAVELRNSSDRFAEADTLKRFDRFLRDRGLTFTVTRTQRNDTQPREAHIEVFHGQQPIQSFTFIPRDEQNLALIGQ